ncbi:metal-dependent transcriptional regulator [Dietzia sp.]|uniref:metal-dependent transcriptional regulator n=1 Tax=Dietzia sp. TaxID=1871616 RepID=UPI002FDA9C4D
MKDLVDTTEMYLRTILDLEEEGIVPLRARIAERLEQSGPTVSQTIARMERDGLVFVASDRHLELTEAGRETAVNVMRKHRLAERLLVDVIGLDLDKVHDEACRWEHVISEDVERRLVNVLHNPTVSPYGNPIPGLKALGVDVETEKHTFPRLAEIPLGKELELSVHALGEQVQVDTDFFHTLIDLDIAPGRKISAKRTGHTVAVHTEKGDINVDLDKAHAIRVEVLG